MIIDAVVLAGGRGSRLGGVSKAGLLYDGTSLLERTIAAVGDARHVVVVGDTPQVAGVPVVRESPAFAGPAAGIAAGLELLGELDVIASDFTVVVACDMPRVALALPPLLDAVAGDGVVALGQDGRAQQLVGVYSTALLRRAAAAHREAGDLENLSVRALLATLHPLEIAVPAGSTDDVDTWDDAARLGVADSPPHARAS
jgi:molybdopterin-guanine dinucleotide biosynthesis protein A